MTGSLRKRVPPRHCRSGYEQPEREILPLLLTGIVTGIDLLATRVSELVEKVGILAEIDVVEYADWHTFGLTADLRPGSGLGPRKSLVMTPSQTLRCDGGLCFLFISRVEL